MNETIQRLLKHASIRKFKDKPVSKEILNSIISAAQMASSSSNMQAYSVILVADLAKKRKLAILTGNQAYVEHCPIFLVWCADLYRLKASTGLQPEKAYIGTTENLVVALVDVALAAQNAVVAAESLGLGAVYIGGIRNEITEVAEILQLPELVIPVFGMCLGYPDQAPVSRPRLPIESILHEDVYCSEQIEKHVENYNATTKQYMLERTNGKSDKTWAQAMQEKLSKPVRMHMNEFIKTKGFFDHEI
jgi:FMN reductase (NADPH)